MRALSSLQDACFDQSPDTEFSVWQPATPGEAGKGASFRSAAFPSEFSLDICRRRAGVHHTIIRSPLERMFTAAPRQRQCTETGPGTQRMRQ